MMEIVSGRRIVRVALVAMSVPLARVSFSGGVLAAAPDGVAAKASPAADANADAVVASQDDAAADTERGDPTPTRDMTEHLDVELRADPRKEFTVEGPVEFADGKLILGAGGSVRRALDAGSQMSLTLTLAFTPLEDGQTSTTRFSFQIRDRGEFVARLLRRRENGKTVSELQFVNQDTPYFPALNRLVDLKNRGFPAKEMYKPKKSSQVLRTFKWQRDFADGAWTFRHHDGLLAVYGGKERMGLAYADKAPTQPLCDGTISGMPNQCPGAFSLFWICCGTCEPLEATGWTLKQEGAPLACQAVSGMASLSYTKREGVAGEIERATKQHLLQSGGHLRQRHRIRAGRAAGKTEQAPKDDRLHFVDTRALDNLRLRIVRPVAQHQPGALPQLCEQQDTPLRYIRAFLGDRHAYEALALQGLGMQLHWNMHWASTSGIAEQLLKRATEVSAESLGPLHPDSVLAAMSLASVYRDRARLDLAEPLLVQARTSTAEVFGERSGQYALTTRELALLYRATGRLAEAESLLREAVAADKDASLHERAEMLPAMVSLAEIETQLGENQKAEKLLLRASQTISDLDRAGKVLVPPETWRQFEDRTQITDQIGTDLAKVEVLLGWRRLHAGQRAEARKLARSAFLKLVTFFSVHDGGKRRYDVGFQGWNSQMTNVQIPHDRNVHPQEHAEYRRLMIMLAELFAWLGDEVPALRSIEVTDRLDGLVEYDIAVLCRIMARLCEANPAAQTVLYNRVNQRKALELAYRIEKNRPPADVYWRQLARERLEKFAGREHPETIEILQAQAREQWRGKQPIKAQETLRDACNRALELSDRVVAGLPETQAYMYLEANRPPADLLLSSFRAKNAERARDAYEIIWRSKALVTRQLIERRELLRATAGQPELARLAADLQTTRQKLAWLSLSSQLDDPAARSRELSELTSRKEELEGELARLSGPFRRTHEASRASVVDMVGRLPAGSAVVDLVERWEWAPPSQATETWVRTRCYDAFVVRAAGNEPGWSAAWLPLGDAAPLDRLLDGWIAGLRFKARPDTGAAAELRGQLWEPLEASLEGCQTVIVIPDGRLAQVPWAALPGRRPGSYLIEDYSLVEAPYGQHVASQLIAPPPAGEVFLGVGGIDYGPAGKWTYLAGSAGEVNEVAGLRQGKETVRLVGQAATKPRLLETLPGARYVHLATHGEFLDPGSDRDGESSLATDSVGGGVLFDASVRNPLLLSMLVLAGANQPAPAGAESTVIGGDGLLTAEEVTGTDLSRTELVVLSACETGLGRIRSGEGVFSLQRAFQVAGARSVVASLWKIPDGATSALMQRFYSNLWQKKMGKLAALREAQIWMLREVPRDAKLRATATRGLDLKSDVPEASFTEMPPFYWAAFVLSGDWR